MYWILGSSKILLVFRLRSRSWRSSLWSKYS